MTVLIISKDTGKTFETIILQLVTNVAYAEKNGVGSIEKSWKFSNRVDLWTKPSPSFSRNKDDI